MNITVIKIILSIAKSMIVKMAGEEDAISISITKGDKILYNYMNGAF